MMKDYEMLSLNALQKWSDDFPEVACQFNTDKSIVEFEFIRYISRVISKFTQNSECPHSMEKRIVKGIAYYLKKNNQITCEEIEGNISDLFKKANND